jgi:TM2 domain-containing membrane protein YozV
MRYYLDIDGKEQGAYTLKQVQNMWLSGSVTGDALFRLEGQTDKMPLWALVHELERSPSMGIHPSLAQQGVAPPKSRGIYIILAILLGALGIHNFYAGHYARGAGQFCLTLFLGWVFIGFILAGIWAILEAIFEKYDANGNLLV